MNRVFIVLLIQSAIALLLQPPKLIFLQSIIRHGAKYPSHPLTGSRINNLNWKQLTNQGRASHYLLGKKMYEKYWKRLFGDTANNNTFYLKKITVLSTNLNRTIQSAESHLFGLLQSLPPLTVSGNVAIPYSSSENEGQNINSHYVFGQNGKNQHPIHINIESGKQTFSQRYFKFERLWEKKNFNSKFAKKVKSYQPFIQAIRKFEDSLNLPNGSINFTNYNNQYNNQESMKSLGYSSIFQPNSVFDSLNGIIFGIRFYLTEKQKQIISKDLIGLVINNIKNFINNRNSPQWAIYCDHQLSILFTLAGLNMMSAECIFENYVKNITNSTSCVTTFPAFASILVFEVYQYPNKIFTFKINYNGKYYQIPLCGGQLQCQFQKLSNWFDTWKGIKEQYIRRLKRKFKVK